MSMKRYTAIIIGLGAAGLAIGWLGPDLRQQQITR
jgi:hypothetical protein